jgi:DNA repair protein RecO (recombination protein O)
MSRTAVYSALVLRSRPSGESNTEVTLLTAEEGIVAATVFGGPKSKLRAFASPYNSGQVWIYRDKSKNYGKLSDFDVRNWRPGLREMYERTMSAAAIAQTILSSHGGGGEWGIVLKLVSETLDILENASEDQCEYLLLYFLWQWTGFLGIQPCIDFCSTCGQGEREHLWFCTQESTALCENCFSVDRRQMANQVNRQLKLNPECRRWFSSVRELEASQVNRYSMDSKSLYEAKYLVTEVLAGILGKKLTGWDW